jgi:hypothetical protein
VTEHSHRKSAAATGDQAAWILPELRELLGLLGKLAEPLPYPAESRTTPAGATWRTAGTCCCRPG